MSRSGPTAAADTQHHPPAAADTLHHPPARTVIVAGAGAPAGLAAEAARLGAPLLADPLSGARSGGAAIAHYDLLVRGERFCAAHQPELVVRVGELPTSKPLRTWLASLEARQIALDPLGLWHDPAGVVAERVAAGSLGAAQPHPEAAGWLDSWRAADAAVANALGEILGDELSEPLVAARLGGWLGPDAILFVASSMPIRDVEEFAPARVDGPRVVSNRGANGIDGTVSSAFGAAAVAGGPVVLLIGDVALAHDIGGLIAARRLGLSVTIVLLNNDGGGIFHFLPVSGETDAFEEHVATPHGLEFVHSAALYGCRYERPAHLAGLRAAVEAGVAGPDTTIIEVRTDRAQNLALHRDIARAALTAVDGL